MRGTVSIDKAINLVQNIPSAAGVFVWTAEFSRQGFNFELERRVFDLYKSVGGVTGKCFDECTSNYKQEDVADFSGKHKRKCTWQRICPNGFTGPTNRPTGGTDCWKPTVRRRGWGSTSQSACGSNCEKCGLLWWVLLLLRHRGACLLGAGAPQGGCLSSSSSSDPLRHQLLNVASLLFTMFTCHLCCLTNTSVPPCQPAGTQSVTKAGPRMAATSATQTAREAAQTRASTARSRITPWTARWALRAVCALPYLLKPRPAVTNLPRCILPVFQVAPPALLY